MTVLAVAVLIVGVAVAITIVNIAIAVLTLRSDRRDSERRNHRP